MSPNTSARPALLDPADLSRQRAEDAQYYREVLHRLIAMGTDLAGAVHRQATAEPSASPEEAPEAARAGDRAPVPAAMSLPDAATAFDRVARTVRRTILLARKLSEPDRAPAPGNRIGRHPVSALADAARRRPRHGEAEPLTQELLDRLDSPDFDEFDEDLGEQPLDTFIAGLRRDLARAVPPGAPIWKPRTSQDVWDLCVRAAQLKAGEPQPGQPAPPSEAGPGDDTGPPAS